MIPLVLMALCSMATHFPLGVMPPSLSCWLFTRTCQSSFCCLGSDFFPPQQCVGYAVLESTWNQIIIRVVREMGFQPPNINHVLGLAHVLP